MSLNFKAMLVDLGEFRLSSGLDGCKIAQLCVVAVQAVSPLCGKLRKQNGSGYLFTNCILRHKISSDNDREQQELFLVYMKTKEN